jgi:hypothetical protein
MATRRAELYRLEMEAVTEKDRAMLDGIRQQIEDLEALDQAKQEQVEREQELKKAEQDRLKAQEQAERDRQRIFDSAARAMQRHRTEEEIYIDTVKDLMQWLDIGAITQEQFVRAKDAAAAELGKDVKLGKMLSAEEGMRAGSAEAIRGARMQWMTGGTNAQSKVDTTELDKKADEQLKAMQQVAENTRAMSEAPPVVRVAGAF